MNIDTIVLRFAGRDENQGVDAGQSNGVWSVEVERAGCADAAATTRGHGRAAVDEVRQDGVAELACGAGDEDQQIAFRGSLR